MSDEALPVKRKETEVDDENRPLKKAKVSSVFLDSLPGASLYEKSYMHRYQVTQIAYSTLSEFIATGSSDGFVKLWKKL